MITKVKNTVVEVNNTFNQYYGGYFAYWKLYSSVLIQIKQKKLKINIFKRICMFIWFCLLKPIGYVFHYTINYKGQYTIKETNYDTTFNNDSIIKSKTYYLFRIIPIWYYNTNKLTDKDINYLTK